MVAFPNNWKITWSCYGLNNQQRASIYRKENFAHIVKSMLFIQSSNEVVLIYLWSLTFSHNPTLLTWAIFFGSLGPGHASFSHCYWFLVSGNLRLTPRRTLYSFLFRCCHCFFFLIFPFLFSLLRQPHWLMMHYVADSDWKKLQGICLVSFQFFLSPFSMRYPAQRTMVFSLGQC